MESSVSIPADALALIRSRMVEFGLTQDQLAQLLNLSQPRLSEMLLGQKSFRSEIFAHLIAVLALPDLASYSAQPLSDQEKARQDCRLALQMIGHALTDMAEHERQEFLFGVATLLEGKPPYGLNRYSRVLRVLANLVPKPHSSVATP